MVATLRHLLTPQKSNNHRPRMIHVEGYLVLVGLVIGAQFLVSTLSKQTGPLPAILGFTSSITPSQVVDQTNGQRQAGGLTNLTLNPVLSSAATAKANHMCSEQYWAHISPGGVTPWVFMKNAGYKYSVAGENLARDFADTNSMVAAWMASPTHKANIVNGKYSEIGIGVVHCQLLGSDTALVVQMFGSQVVPTAPQPTLAPIANTEPETVEVQTLDPILPTEAPVPAEEPNAQVAGQESIPRFIANADPALSLSTPRPVSEIPPVFTRLQVTKAILLSILVTVLAVLFVDMWFTHRRKTVRVAGRNLGHMLFLAGILVVIIIVKAGLTL